MDQEEVSPQRCSNSPLGRWLAKTGGGFHPNLSFTELGLNNPPNKKMGHGVYARGTIYQNETLASCSTDASITAQKSLLQFQKLLDACLNRQLETENRQIAGYDKELYEKITMGWINHQAICLYLMLSKLSIEPEGGSSLEIKPNDGIHTLQDNQEPTHAMISQLFSYHKKYVGLLPPPEELLTPLYWNKKELSKLIGTDLYQASIELKQDWESEFKAMMNGLHKLSPKLHHYLSQRLTNSDYLWASTILSSRSFPSTLLQDSRKGDDSQAHIKIDDPRHKALGFLDDLSQAVPMLLPGIDIINHKRRAKVEWRAINTGGLKGCVDRIEVVTLEESTEIGQQVFNNYGPKSTVELILGYGFALDASDWKTSQSTPEAIMNPDDFFTIALTIPNPQSVISPIIHSIFNKFDRRDLSHFIKADQPIPDILFAQLKLVTMSSTEDWAKFSHGFTDLLIDADRSRITFKEKFMQQFPIKTSWENELDCLDCLRTMIEVKLEQLQQIDHRSENASDWDGVRPEVKRMIQIYRQGQESIMIETLKKLNKQFETILKDAETDGFHYDCYDSFDEDLDDDDYGGY